MATPETVGVAKNTSLSNLNKVIAQQEELLGPLTAVGNDGNDTLLTFDMDLEPPTKHAVLILKVGGQGVIPHGKLKVCEGNVFITSQLMGVVAAR